MPQVSLVAKKVLFPSACFFDFDKRGHPWLEPLTCDAAYLNAMIYSTQNFFDLEVGSRRQPSQGPAVHFVKAVRLLRERLVLGDDPLRFSDTTLSVVLTLAVHAHAMGDGDTERHHMEGARRIVDLRGGIPSLTNMKLLIEFLRCDIGMVLHSGTKPLFFNDPFWEPVMPYPHHMLSSSFSPATTTPTGSPARSDPFLEDLHADLLGAWDFMVGFCATINSAIVAGDRLPEEILLDSMASVMYRLIAMSFERASPDEVIRLALLAFCAHIFLRWNHLKPPNLHVSVAYRDSLAGLSSLHTSGSRIVPWLLMVGAMSIFEDYDGPWLRPWLRMSIDMNGVDSWTEMREILKSFLWIDLLHDMPGKDLFDSARSSSQKTSTMNGLSSQTSLHSSMTGRRVYLASLQKERTGTWQ